MQLRSANEAALSASLMDHMWDYCEADVIEYYDGVLAEPYDERGYKVDMAGGGWIILPQCSQKRESSGHFFPHCGQNILFLSL